MLKLSRRAFVGGACGAAAVLTGAPRGASASAPVKVGVSLAMSGPAAAIGESIWRGANLYHKVNKASLPGGLAIDVVLRDDAGNSDNIKRIAQELIVRERVKLMAGATLSPQAFTLAPLMTQAKMPLVVMNASTASVPRESPFFVRTSATLWQTGYTTGEWAAQNGYKKVFTLAADYAAGVDCEAAFVQGFKSKGGEVVGGVRTPVATTDYLPFMQNIKASGADTLFMFVNVGRVNAAIAAYAGAALREAGVRLIGTGDIAPDDEILHAGPGVVGLVNGAVYYVGNPIAANTSYVEAWKAEYGADSIPNYLSVGGWDGMAAIYDLVRATNGEFTGEDAMKLLSHWKNPDSPRGPIYIDPQTRDIVQSIYIDRVEMIDGKPTNVNFAKVESVKDPWKEMNPPK